MCLINVLFKPYRCKSSQLSIFVILGILITILSGCTQKSPPLERTFRLAWENAPKIADPRYAIDADSQYLGDFIHCSLISFDPQGGSKNRLASEIKWIDSKTLEITLRTSMRFSNQRPVTAEDVKANYEFLRGDPADPTPIKSTFSPLTKIEVLSPEKLRFYFSEPNGDFVSNLSIGILPKEQAEGPKIIDPKKVMGCGDFEVDQWTVSHIQLKRKWDAPQKDVQFIRIELVKDENTRLLKLRNSELDLVQNSLNRDQLKKLQEYKNLKLLKSPGLNTAYLAFQFEDPILKNRKVRQAISYAIDRKKIMDHIFHGWAIPAATILLPASPFYNQKLKWVDYHPEKAKRLLDEAGFPMKGPHQKEPRFALKLKTTTNPTRLIVAHALAEELNQVGIDLQIESMDWGKFKEDVDKGNAQMWNLNWVGFKGPDIYRYAFSSRSIPPHGANRGRFSDPRLDQLLESAKIEVNFERRKKLYDQVQELVDSELPYIFLWHEEQFAVLNSRVNNYEIYMDGRLSSIADVSFSPNQTK